MVFWQLTVDANDPAGLATFWAQALGYRPVPPTPPTTTWQAHYLGRLGDRAAFDDRLFDPAGLGPAIWFQRVPEAKSGKNRLHLDLYPTGRNDALTQENRVAVVEATVTTLVELGAVGARRERDDDPDDTVYYVVMHDPEGNEFCVSLPPYWRARPHRGGDDLGDRERRHAVRHQWEGVELPAQRVGVDCLADEHRTGVIGLQKDLLDRPGCDEVGHPGALGGVGGLTMSALARRVGTRPPSLYKYFSSLLAIYDAIFRRGQQHNLEALLAGISTAEPGLAAVRAGMVSAGRWAVANPVLAELLFWRPIPGFRPTTEAFAPAVRIVELFRTELANAVAAGELRTEAASHEAMALLSTMHVGVLSQHLANDPDADWDHGVFTRLHPRIFDTFAAAYPANIGR